MNDLQLTLLIVGGGGIAAMIGYNWWQDFRLRKQASERFGENDQDPLLGKGSDSTAQRERAEPGFLNDLDSDSATLADSLLHDQTLSNEIAEPVDKRLFADFLVRFDEPKDENNWKHLIDSFDNINRKRILYSVAAAHSAGDDCVWFKASPFFGQATQLRASVQIANRKGAITSIEFSELVTKLRRYAEEQNGELDFPEMRDVVAKAETLDQAAAALDTLLGLHCMMPEEVDEIVSANLLNQAGWIQKGHQWSLGDASGQLATMVVHNAPGKRLLSFNIDVPNSIDPVKALGEIVTVCHSLNEKYGAPLMDDSGRTLSTQAIEGIYTQLMERVRHLNDSGFKPGDPGSRILFS